VFVKLSYLSSTPLILTIIDLSDFGGKWAFKVHKL